MRTEFVQAMLALFNARRDLVFITGDVGYMALERLAETYGERFINAGIAEQNAVSLAAGLARTGHLPWVYSTAAFTVFRPYEQIRDNVCLHKLPVKLVGNGGGYGFGIMGPTHHALEDVGALRALPNIKLYLPLLASDVAPIVNEMADTAGPTYLRLNAPAELPHPIAAFAPWRRLKEGRSCILIGVGPVLQCVYEMGAPELLAELEIWSVGTLPLEGIPAELSASIRAKRHVVTIEEHYIACGLAEALSYQLLASGTIPESFTSLGAAGYPSGRYGSQAFHQRESGLAGPALVAALEKVLRG